MSEMRRRSRSSADDERLDQDAGRLGHVARMEGPGMIAAEAVRSLEDCDWCGSAVLELESAIRQF